MGKIFDQITEEFEDNINTKLENIDIDSLAKGQFPRSGPTSIEPNEQNIWEKTNTSYSGTDCTVVVQANDNVIVLGNVTTFSYSLHRDKIPIRTLGRTSCKGYVAGGRTVAGSMVFTVFDSHPLMSVIKVFEYIRNPEDRYTSPVPDQLPPLDIILIFHNEYGYSSVVRLYGVEFSDEGTTHSINDIYSESIMQYVARDIDIMVAEAQLREFKDLLFARQVRGGFVDSQLASLISYRNRLLAELEDVNTYINAIDQENGRRAIGGSFIIGGSLISGAGAGGVLGSLIGVSAGSSAVVGALAGKGTTSRTELNNLKEKYLKKKELLLKDLRSVNNQIRQHEQNIRGWNAQNTVGLDNTRSDSGVSSYDRLRTSASASTAPPGKGRF